MSPTRPLFSIEEADMYGCPVMLVIKLHDGRIIFTTGRFERGHIYIERPDPDTYDTFGRFSAYNIPEPHRTEIDIILRTEQVDWKEGPPEWAEAAPKQITGEVAHAEGPLDIDIRGGTVPVPPNRYLPRGSEG